MAILAAVVAFSGGTAVDPPIPRGFPGPVPVFLAVPGKGGWDREGEEREAIPPAWGDTHRAAIRRDRRWLARARPLGDVPPWAGRMYRRSLLVLRAVVDRRTGAAVAGARAGWAYVWPRDAGAVAIALASAGYREEARRIVRFLLGLDLDAAARFDRDGEPVEGRAAQGDAAGWVAAAARAAKVPTARAAALAVGANAAPGSSSGPEARFPRIDWRDRADYQEKDGGDYLGNAVASGLASPHIRRAFATRDGLVRVAGDLDSGLDSAAAWAVRPFPQPALYPAVRHTLLQLVAERKSRFGLLPSEEWDGGADPWTAPTAWTAWALAALANEDGKGAAASGRRGRARRDRRAALTLMADLHRAATPLGLLPERVDAETGLPTSTTPLAWSHAFAVLAIRELWPGRARQRQSDSV